MKCRIVTDAQGREFELTEAEERFVRAVENLEKLNSGRIEMFASGRVNLRINGGWHENSFLNTSIRCEGGDGGD